MIAPSHVIAFVGDERRMIEHDVFLSAFEALAEFYRDEGLEGAALDEAICAAMPGALLAIIGDSAKPH